MIVYLTTTLAAFALSGAGPDDQKLRPPADLNRMICERIKITGSRLGTRRICMTAAQWEDEKRETRQRVQQLQVRGRRDGEYRQKRTERRPV